MQYEIDGLCVVKIQNMVRFMHLFETKEGDKWVCITCGQEQADMIEEKKWEWIFDKDDQTLRCSLCKGPDHDFDDY